MYTAIPPCQESNPDDDSFRNYLDISIVQKYPTTEYVIQSNEDKTNGLGVDQYHSYRTIYVII